MKLFIKVNEKLPLAELAGITEFLLLFTFRFPISGTGPALFLT
jgi:hypothetical protein